MVKAIATPGDRAAVVAGLRVKGDRYGQAAIAALAHELAVRLSGDKLEAGAQKFLADSTGYDKGILSRIATIVRTDKKARTAALKLDVMALAAATSDNKLTPAQVAALDAAVQVGKLFARKPTGKSSSGKGERDVLADLQAWLTDDKVNDNGRAARFAQVEDLIARLRAENAAVTAAA
jgi:hypothetical protein